MTTRPIMVDGKSRESDQFVVGGEDLEPMVTFIGPVVARQAIGNPAMLRIVKSFNAANQA